MLEKIKEILAAELDIDPAIITTETRFKEDLAADSYTLFSLVLDLQDEYGFEIPPEKLEELTTVGKVIDYLKEAGIEA